MNYSILFSFFKHFQKIVLLMLLSFFISTNVFASGSILSKYGYTIDWMLESEMATDMVTINKIFEISSILSNPTHLLLICSNNDVNVSESSDGVITITSSGPTTILDNKINARFNGSSLVVGKASAITDGLKNVFAFGRLYTEDNQIVENYYNVINQSLRHPFLFSVPLK